MKTLLRGAVSVLFPILILSLASPRAQAAQFIVTNAADSGLGTLRQAIVSANTNPGPDTITIALPPSSVIQPLSQLPVITNPVSLVATSVPNIRLDGLNIPSAYGLYINQTTDCLIKGLRIGGFTNSIGVLVSRASNIRIESCLIYSNLYGISLDQSERCVIGGTNAAAGNIISANISYGIAISNLSSNNSVQGNFIGTDETGSSAWSNNWGVYVRSGPGNRIGGTNAVYGTLSLGNLISGNALYGIEVHASGAGTVIQGNFIGTDVTGQNAISNSAGIVLYGSSNLVGGALVGARNIISGNWSAGLYLGLTQAVANVIVGNYIGTDVTGSNAVPNFNGMEIYNAPGNLIGRPVAGEGNVISGNRNCGILISGYTAGSSTNYFAAGTVIRANFIGVDAGGARALPNQGAGVRIECPYTQVGDAAVGAGNVISGNGGRGVHITEEAHHTTILGNMISGNGAYGIELYGTNNYGITIAGNRIGVNEGGAAVGNSLGGIRMWEAWSNTIGKAVAGGRNIISGNGGAGITITYGHDNLVYNNYIGTDPGGTLLVGNSSGIEIWNSWDNEVGGAESNRANLISGNNGAGVYISGSASRGNVVSANRIGLGATGHSLGNVTGILIGGVSNIIGGGSAGDGNIIAYNVVNQALAR